MKSSKFMLILLLLSSSLFFASGKAEACSVYYPRQHVVTELQDVQSLADGSVTGSVVAEKSLLAHVFLLFHDQEGKEVAHLSIATENARAAGVRFVNTTGIEQTLVPVDVYELDFAFTAEEVGSLESRYEVSALASNRDIYEENTWFSPDFFWCGLITSSSEMVTIDKIDADEKRWPHKKNVAADKVWTVSFNQPILNNEQLQNYVYVFDELGNELKNLDVQRDAVHHDKITVTNKALYTPGKTYTLVMYNKLVSESHKRLQKRNTMKFTIEETVLPVAPTCETILGTVASLGGEAFYVFDLPRVFVPAAAIDPTFTKRAEIHLANGDVVELNPNAYDSVVGDIYEVGLEKSYTTKELLEATVRVFEERRQEKIVIDEEKQVVRVSSDVTYEEVYDYVVDVLKEDFSLYRSVAAEDFSMKAVDTFIYSGDLFAYTVDAGERLYMQVSGRDVDAIRVMADAQEILVPQKKSLVYQDVIDQLKLSMEAIGKNKGSIAAWSRDNSKDIVLDDQTLLMVVSFVKGKGLLYTYYPFVVVK